METRDRKKLRDARRHPREKVCWPVVVDDGQRFVHAETMNVGPYGAKVRMRDRLALGTQVGLRFAPEDRAPFDVRAIVWRLDEDGPALLFLGTHSKDFPFPVPPLAAAAREGQRAALSGTETVLLVDDDPGSRALALDALEGAGYTVLDAGEDPIKAVRLVKEQPGPVHLLLTDIVMPLASGHHLVERLAPLRPDMKVVFMSAYPVSGVPLAGAGYLPKPFGADDLLGKVREVLDARSPFARPRPPAPRG